GRDDAILSRRPDGKNWAAKEVVCHLRDIEEMFMGRFGLILAMDDPKLAFDPTMPDRWAEERQYLRNDGEHALRASRKRRDEPLPDVRGLLLGDRGAEQLVGRARRPDVTPTAIPGAGTEADIPALRRWPQRQGFTRRLGGGAASPPREVALGEPQRKRRRSRGSERLPL